MTHMLTTYLCVHTVKDLGSWSSRRWCHANWKESARDHRAIAFSFTSDYMIYLIQRGYSIDADSWWWVFVTFDSHLFG